MTSTSKPLTPPPNRNRIRWVDALRGLAILLVVLHHADSLYTSPGAQESLYLTLILRPFRMPVLMLLSGALVPHSLAKGPLRYFDGKFRGVLWPYVIWQAQFIAMAGSVLGLLKLNHWGPISQLWFLFYIIIFYIAAGLLYRLSWPALIAICAAMWLFVPASMEPHKIGFFGIFFFTGALLGTRLYHWHGNRTQLVFALVALPAVMLIATKISPDTYGWPYFALSVLAVTTIVTVFSTLPHRSVLRLLAWVGERSLVFYVVHFPALVYLQEVFDLVGLHHHLKLPAFLCALVICYFFALLRATPPFSWLFSSPISLSRFFAKRNENGNS